MNRGQGWKKRFCTVCGSLLLLCAVFVPGKVFAAESAENQSVETEESWTVEWTKGQKVAGFLVIFTVFCGGTAYLVMRPSLKKLKEAKKRAAEIKSDSETKPKI